MHFNGVKHTNLKPGLYNALGNIEFKTGVGTYTYLESCNGIVPGPHAVTSVSGPQGGNYCYDENGNIVSDGQQTIRYTADNRPNQFLINNSVVAEFEYSPLRNRMKKRTSDKTLYYIGQDEVGKVLYEREEGSELKHRYFIYAGDLPIANVEQIENGTPQVEYLHRDHLNSIEAVSNASGQIILRKSFDTFGRPRETDWRDPAPFDIIPQEGKRGYTNHEHIDETGHIHMNGRVYNPILGRFLTPDPTIPFAEVQQSYNRYSYVRNNPLKYTDPTGYTEEELHKKTEAERRAEEFRNRQSRTSVSGQGGLTSGQLKEPPNIIYKSTSAGVEQQAQGGSELGSPIDTAARAAIGAVGKIATETFALLQLDQLDLLTILLLHKEGLLDDVIINNIKFEAQNVVKALDEQNPEAFGESVVGVASALLVRRVPNVAKGVGKFKADDFVGADAMSSKQFRKLVKDIAQNGLKNKEIEFVMKDGIPHVTFGSNRLAAAKHLGIADQLKFVEKTVPTRGFQTLDDVTRVPPPKFRGPPVTMKSN